MITYNECADVGERIIDMIRDSFEPEDFYDQELIPKEEVINYVHDNCDIEDVYSLSEITNYITENYLLEEIFEDHELVEWAKRNEFIKKKG